MFLKSEKLTKSQKKESVVRLFEESTPNYDFFLMLILSSIIVTLGLLRNNTAVIIGGMLVTPILSPILSLAMGVVVGNYKLMRRSGLVILQSSAIVFIISLAISLLVMDREVTYEILTRVEPRISYFLIALFSGGAVAYALVRPSLSEILPGVAISVSLIPPLSALGVTISLNNWGMAVGTLELFILNLIGIISSAVIVFAILKFYEVKDCIEQRIRAEEKVIKEEEKESRKEKIEEMEKQIKEMSEVLKEKKGK